MLRREQTIKLAMTDASKNSSAKRSGILLLDKPGGLSSNGALRQVKSLLQISKAGHTGSLDPIATGLLPICLGESTKVAGFFLDADKQYRARIRLGETTDTGDREGRVIQRHLVSVTQIQLEAVLDQFIGEYDQVPPMYSAVKVNGQPLYKLARRGIEVGRAARKVKIHSMTLRDFAQQSFEIDLTCSSGFYVRVLAREIGEKLQCGGHVESLRRLRVGDLSIAEGYTLEAIEQIDSIEGRRNLVIPGDETLTHLPNIDLSIDAAYYLCRGQVVRAENLPPDGIMVRLYESTAGLLVIGKSLGDGRVAPKRIFHASGT